MTVDWKSLYSGRRDNWRLGLEQESWQITDLRSNAQRRLNSVRRGELGRIITSNGDPTLVIVPFDTYLRHVVQSLSWECSRDVVRRRSERTN